MIVEWYLNPVCQKKFVNPVDDVHAWDDSEKICKQSLQPCSDSPAFGMSREISGIIVCLSCVTSMCVCIYIYIYIYIYIAVT